MTVKPRVLFYAINGVGLGHVVRLSKIASEIDDRAVVACYSNSPAAPEYWSGNVYCVDDDRTLSPEVRAARVLRGFYAALARFEPDVVVCDTHWPRPLIRNLHDRGVRTVLVLRALETEAMMRAVATAETEFSRVLLPHHPAELLWLYRDRPELLFSLSRAPFVTIGPVARTPLRGSDLARVFVTVGGGGEYHRHDPANSLNTYLDACVAAAKELHQHFGLEPVLAVGPLMDERVAQASGLEVVRTDKLHEFFGPNTLVIARGGYNTAWEALATGAKLILVGSHKGAEDVGARARFLEEAGVARHVSPVASEIFTAGSSMLEDSPQTGNSYLYKSVNVGLKLAADEIVNTAYIRDRGAQTFYGVRALSELTKSSRPVIGSWDVRRLRVVRFDDVSLGSPHQNVVDLSQLALALGYRVQAHVMPNSGAPSRTALEMLEAGVELWCHGSAHKRGRIETLSGILRAVKSLAAGTGYDVKGVSYPYDGEGPAIDELRREGLRLSTLLPGSFRAPDEEVCVDVCSWPGPRWRSELALGFVVASHSIDGLCFHADRMDKTPQEALLRMFVPN